MPEKDILGELSKDPIYRETAAATDKLIGSDFVGELQRHEQEKRNEQADLGIAQTARNLVPNGAPVNSPFGPVINTPPANNPFSELTASEQSKAYAHQVGDLMRNPDAWVDKSKNWSKPFGFDTGRADADFDRFYAYGKPFKELGYVPWRDNEALYNANTSWWDDFRRMSSVWPSLAGSAFTSVIGNPFDWSADTETSADFERNMKIAMSSKKGFGAKFTNLAANSAFTFGIGAELLMENIVYRAVAAAMTASGIGAAPGLVAQATITARTINGLRKIFGGVGAIKNVAGQAKMVGQTTEAFVNTGKTIQNTRNFWNIAKEVGTGAVKDMFRFPLGTETGKFAKNLYLGKNGYDKLSDFAAFRKGVGSLYMDIRELNYAVSEARMEGGSVTNNLLHDLNKEYYDKHGKMAEGAEAEAITQLAQKAGNKTSLINIPTIYLTNKLVFGKGFRGFTPASALRAEMGEQLGKTIIIDEAQRALGKPVAEAVGGFKKFLKTGYWKQAPLDAAGSLLRYTQANWSEGFQESAQAVISSAVEQYYNQVYHDPAMAGSRQAWSAFEKGVGKQFTGQGAETFLSGFLMGALVGPVQNFIYTNAWDKFNEHADPAEWKKLKLQQKERTDRVVNAINKMDPKQYFSVLEQNMVTQVQLDKLMDQADEARDPKAFHDAKGDSMFNHFHSMLETGNFDYFVSRLKDLKNLTPEELKELSNNAPLGNKYNKSASMYDRIDKVVERAEQIKRRYDEVNERFQDTPDIYRFSEAKNKAQYDELFLKMTAYKEAKKQAVYASYGFDDATQRMSSILDDIANINKPLSKASSADFTILLNKTQIQGEMNALRQEATLFDTGTAEQKKKATEAKEKLEKLALFSADRDNYEDIYKLWKEKKAKKSEVTAALKDLKKSYYGYVKHLAKSYGEILIDFQIEPSFEGIRDHIQLGDDANRFAGVINVLHDPKNFLNIADRLTEVVSTHYKNRTDAMLIGFERYKDREDEKSLLNALYDAGVFIDPKSIKDLKKGNLDNIEFLGVVGEHGQIDKKSDFYINKILPILKKYKVYKEVIREQKEEAVPGEIISDEEYKDFTENHTVSPERIEALAKKINKEPLTERETAMYNAAVAQVNAKAIELKAKAETKAPEKAKAPEFTEIQKAILDNQKYVDKSKNLDGIDPTNSDYYLISSPEDPTKFERYKRVTRVIPDDFEGTGDYSASQTAGKTVDKIGRLILAGETLSYDKWKGKISESAFTSLVKQMQRIKTELEAKGWKLMTNDLVIFDRAAKVAGTLDILAEDKAGNLHILDFKTMQFGKYDLYDTPFKAGKMTKLDQHTNQMTAYDILINNQYDKNVKSRIIIPFEHSYNSKGFITAIERKPDKPLGYNREIETLIPRTGGTKKGITKETVVIPTSALGSIAIDQVEDKVFSGETTTTVRSDFYHDKFYKGDGVYKTKKGNFVNITYRGKIKLKGDKIVGDGFTMTKDEFALAEGFKNWKTFDKEAKWAGRSLIDGETVNLYDISPADEGKGIGKIIYVSLGAGGPMLVSAYPERYVDGDAIMFNHVKNLEKEYGADQIKAPASAQQAGLVFLEFYNSREADEKQQLKDEIQYIFKAKAEEGKTVITSNWAAREIADEAYISTDKKKLISVLETLDPEKTDAQIAKRAEQLMKDEKAEEFLKPGVVYNTIKGNISEELFNKKLEEQKLYDKFVAEMKRLSPEELDDYFDELTENDDVVNTLSVATLEELEGVKDSLKVARPEKLKMSKVKKGTFVQNKEGAKYKVIRKGKRFITVKLTKNQKAVPVTMTKKEAKKKFKDISKKKQSEALIAEQVMSGGDINIAKENVGNVDTLQDNPKAIRDSVKAGVKDPEKATNNFINNLKKCGKK